MADIVYSKEEMQKWANAAYSAADAHEWAQAIKGAALGALGGAIAGSELVGLVQYDFRGWPTTLIGLAIGGLLGWWGASGQVSIMKLIAQLILVQAKIEENTKGKQ